MCKWVGCVNKAYQIVGVKGVESDSGYTDMLSFTKIGNAEGIAHFEGR